MSWQFWLDHPKKGALEKTGAGAEQVFEQAKSLCPHLRGEACWCDRIQVHEVMGRSEKARREHQFSVSDRKLWCNRAKINRRKSFFTQRAIKCVTLPQDVLPPDSIGGGGTSRSIKTNKAGMGSSWAVVAAWTFPIAGPHSSLPSVFLPQSRVGVSGLVQTSEICETAVKAKFKMIYCWCQGWQAPVAIRSPCGYQEVPVRKSSALRCPWG